MLKKKKIDDAVEIIDRKYFANNREMQAMLEEARANDEIARKIYELRTRAKLTQKQLAKMIGTSPSVISRLEDADYEGHSLAMLNRIATAMNKRVAIEFIPLPKKRKSA